MELKSYSPKESIQAFVFDPDHLPEGWMLVNPELTTGYYLVDDPDRNGVYARPGDVIYQVKAWNFERESDLAPGYPGFYYDPSEHVWQSMPRAEFEQLYAPVQ